MIRYTLKCDHDHSFDSWFQSADAFEKLRAAGMVACTFCGSDKVEKALMAPAVRPARKAAPDMATPDALTSGALTPGAPSPGAPGALSTPQSPAEAALAAMRREIEANSDYVGLNFATEARAMHEGAAPTRAIHGEAKLDEARALLEDGIPVTPLPFLPARKTN